MKLLLLLALLAAPAFATEPATRPYDRIREALAPYLAPGDPLGWPMKARAVNVADPSGNLVDNATFPAATPGSSFQWDANNVDLGVSQVGQNGAYQAFTDGAGGPGLDVASPGFAAGLGSVPEPASLGLIGLAGLALVRRRRAAK